MTTRFDGRVALVTGGASGIGRACVQRFLDDGANVVVGDLDELACAALEAEHAGRVAAQRCDVTVEADVESLSTLALSRFGRLDITVANAGRGMIDEHAAEEFRAIVDVCLTGVFLTIKHGGRVMGDGGSIVAISSLNGVQPSAGMSAYCAAKAGVIMLTRVAAMELGARGIRVNAVGPGLIETPATGTFFSLPGLVEEFVENTTVGRHGRPDEVAGLVAWLASDEARFVSGSFHLIDGGASNKRYPDIPGAIDRVMRAGV
jgi:NAD(P)-dependent dehydrogenase (short-subunit alcohol dehydrogenase family)